MAGRRKLGLEMTPADRLAAEHLNAAAFAGALAESDVIRVALRLEAREPAGPGDREAAATIAGDGGPPRFCTLRVAPEDEKAADLILARAGFLRPGARSIGWAVRFALRARAARHGWRLSP